MKIRIGCGLLCNLLCVITAAILQEKHFNLTSSSQLGWLVLPAILIALGDTLTVVTGELVIS